MTLDDKSPNKTFNLEADLLNKMSYFWYPDYLEPSTWVEHIPFAFWLIETLKPKSIVELGVYRGTSYFSFCQAVAALNIPCVCYGVDTWKGDEHSGFYSDSIYNLAKSYNEKFLKFSTLIQSSFDEANNYFLDESIDLLHIDGYHTYDEVKHDFLKWLPKLSKDAIVMFHDINVREREFGVFKLWDELSKDSLHFHFDFGYGLGVLGKGSNYPPELLELLKNDQSSDKYIFLRNFFSDRGRMFKQHITNIAMGQDIARLTTNNQSLQKQLEENNALIEKLKRELQECKESFINPL